MEIAAFADIDLDARSVLPGVVTLSHTERNLPTIANVDARDFKDLACWLIVQIGPIALNVTTPSTAQVGRALSQRRRAPPPPSRQQEFRPATPH